MRRRIPILAVAVLGAFALFWRLGDRYLWQDEAATALLARRMLECGKPLAFDGVNLVTLDNFGGEDLSTIDQRTHSERAAVAYYLGRGDYKPDTAWKWHPWGQFLAAAASQGLFGSTTWAARFPFALAGLLTILGVSLLAAKGSRDPWAPIITPLLLTLNGEWVLHARQCRYYALSGFFLVATVLTFLRWRRGGRWGAAAFVGAAWCWFQVDYGTVWPVWAVLFGFALSEDLLGIREGALRSRARAVRATLGAGLALAAAVAPFAAYYELWGRWLTPQGTWSGRFLGNLSNVNLYVAPLLVLAAGAAFLVRRWRGLEPWERRLPAVTVLAVLALLVWVPTTAPASFHRYVVMATPLGCFLAAWVAGALARALAPARWAPVVAAALVAVLALTSWTAWPVAALLPTGAAAARPLSARPDLRPLWVALFEKRPDPNRLVAEWLRANAAPTDPILVNYEDVPLMFYLRNPIRGGLVAFGAEDPSLPPPRFAVLRRSVSFCYWPAFLRELHAYQWQLVPVQAPDVRWGNNPDPSGEADVDRAGDAPPLVFLRRLDGP